MRHSQSEFLVYDELECNERRSSPRQQLVMRVGILEQDNRTILCLIRNISSTGIQLKPYGPVEAATSVTLRVGDEDSISGQVAWAKNGLIGMKFEHEVGLAALLRVAPNDSAVRRRGAPRIATDMIALLRTGGKVYQATLCDLSVRGARLRVKEPIGSGEAGILEIRGLPCLRCFVRWKAGTEIGVLFETPLSLQSMQSIAGVLN